MSFPEVTGEWPTRGVAVRAPRRHTHTHTRLSLTTLSAFARTTCTFERKIAKALPSRIRGCSNRRIKKRI